MSAWKARPPAVRVVPKHRAVYNHHQKEGLAVPELPEVETVVRDLRPRLRGRRIVAVWVGEKNLRRPYNPQWTAKLIGKRIKSLSRRGKWIILCLDKNIYLLFHLGMTGQLTVVGSEKPVLPHTHLIMGLNPTNRELAGERSLQLRFRDVRRFGSVTFFPNEMDLENFFNETRLGPEPFDLDSIYWQNCLARTSRCLKAVLLDQRVLAGVGNIYSDEALFEARLHPKRMGRKIGSREAGRLRRAILTVLSRAIEKRGSSIRDYVRGNGHQGEYQEEFRVYGRAGEPCPRCRRPIRHIRLAGRSTHYCPGCQRQS